MSGVSTWDTQQSNMHPAYLSWNTNNPSPLSQTHIKRGKTEFKLVSQDCEVEGHPISGRVKITNVFRWEDIHDGVKVDITLQAIGENMVDADAKMYDKVKRLEGHK